MENIRILRAEAIAPVFGLAFRKSGARALHGIAQQRNPRVRIIGVQQRHFHIGIILRFIHQQMIYGFIRLHKAEAHHEIRLRGGVLPPEHVRFAIFLVGTAQRPRRFPQRILQDRCAGHGG